MKTEQPGRIYGFLTVCIGFLLWGHLYAQELKSIQSHGVIIVNRSVPIDSLSQNDLKKIYSGKTELWENSLAVQPCVMDNNSSVSKRFFSKLLDTSHREFTREWFRKLFSGSSPIPPTLKTDQEVIEYVSRKSGGIGFISEAKRLPETIKTIKIDTKNSF